AALSAPTATISISLQKARQSGPTPGCACCHLVWAGSSFPAGPGSSHIFRQPVRTSRISPFWSSTFCAFAVFWRSSNEIQYPLGKGSVPLYLATSSKTPRPTIDLTLAASPCTVPSGRGGALLYVLFS